MTEHEFYLDGKKKYLAETKKNPQDSDAWRNLAQACMMLGEIEEAVDYNIEALRLDPTSEWGLILMGNIMCFHKKDVDAAILYYKKAIDAHPKSVLALSNLAGALAEKGDVKEAVRYFYKSLEVDDRNINAWCGLAMCFFRSEMFDSAYRAAMKGLELGKMLTTDNVRPIVQKLSELAAASEAKLKASGEFNEASKSLEEDLQERKQEKQAQFDERHKDGGGPAVTMMMQFYMQGAMKEYEQLTPQQVKKIALEFAVQGEKGYSVEPDAKYSIPSLPGKVMSGYQTLAYYYVAMAQAFPELLPQLGLPFSDAYEMAKALKGGKQ